MSETFYDLLDVEPDADSEAIEQAYRTKVKETHPDVSDAPDAEDRFKRVQRAKEVLTDDEERARYDRLGHDQYLEHENNSPGPVNDPGGGPGSSAGRDQSRGTDRGRERGEDRGRTSGGSGDAGRGSNRDQRDGQAGSGGRSRRDRATNENPFDFGTVGSQDGSTERSSGTGPGGTSASSGDTAADARGETVGDAGDGEHGWGRSRAGPSSNHGSTEGGSAYATRTRYREQTVDSVRIPLTPRTIVQITSMFVLYPVFVAASLFPAFPVTVNLVVGLCTLFLVAYLMSIPEVALVVFGGWSVLTPLLLVALEPFSLFSLFGIVTLLAAWFPFGLAVLTRAVMRS